MSQQASPLTYEELLNVFRAMIAESGREFDRRMVESDRSMAESRREFDQSMAESRREFDQRMAESDRKWEALRKQMKKTDERIGFVDARIGELVEGMVGGDNIVTQFRNLGYNVSTNVRNEIFGTNGTETYGEVDLLLEDGDVAILIEIKTKLTVGKILKHVQRLEKYRRWHDMQGTSKKRYVGAIACAIMKKEVVQFAQTNGLYVIAQLGNKVEIVASPEGFKAKEW